MIKSSKHWLKKYWRFILYAVLIGLFLVFLRKSSFELQQIGSYLEDANPWYLGLGLLTTLAYVLVQSWILSNSLKALRQNVPFINVVSLFLKRYFMATFIPVGFSAAQFTLNSTLERHNVKKMDSYLASTIYITTGYVSYILITVPIAAYLLYIQPTYGFILTYLVLFLLGTWFLVYEVRQLIRGKGLICSLLKKFYPQGIQLLSESKARHIRKTDLMRGLFISLLLSVIGGMFFFFSLKAVGANVAPIYCLAAYIISIILLSFAPIFQGLVLIEFALTYVLRSFGINNNAALAGTIIYRFLQLWLPVFIGGLMLLRTILQNTWKRYNT